MSLTHIISYPEEGEENVMAVLSPTLVLSTYIQTGGILQAQEHITTASATSAVDCTGSVLLFTTYMLWGMIYRAELSIRCDACIYCVISK